RIVHRRHYAAPSERVARNTFLGSGRISSQRTPWTIPKCGAGERWLLRGHDRQNSKWAERVSLTPRKLTYKRTSVDSPNGTVRPCSDSVSRKPNTSLLRQPRNLRGAI